MSIYLSFGALFVKWIRARSIFKAFKREIEREKVKKRGREKELFNLAKESSLFATKYILLKRERYKYST